MAGIDAALDVLRPGARVFIPGSSGEPGGLVEALEANPDATRDVDLTLSFVPGLNRLDLGALGDGARVTGLFMQPAFAAAQRSGRFRHLPVSYAAFQRHCEDGPAYDAAIVQVAPPDAQGRLSLGPAAEFTPTIAARCGRLIGVINPHVPVCRGSVHIDRSRFDRLLQSDAPLATYDPGPAEEISSRIGKGVAALVEDGAALQFGLGKIPSALAGQLADRRGLRLHTGLMSDGALALYGAGALATNQLHRTCVLAGSKALYDRITGDLPFAVVGCDQTHALGVLAMLDRFIAINSALEVDLFGQASLEIAGARALSGPGGAPDFARAARLSPGGLSIVALPSGTPARPRIVSRLRDAHVTLPRTDVDVVVTEHGAAHLRDRSVHERAEALIAIADPATRSDLQDRWREIAAAL